MALGFARADLQSTAAEVRDQFSDAVVHVKAIIESRGREREVEGLGTIVDEQGTVVMAYSHFRQDELKDVRCILGDGTEYPATVVLHDKDLDLSFLKPQEDAAETEGLEFTPIGLGGDPVQLQLADPVIILSREGSTFRRQATLLQGQVVTIIDEPRRYYRTDVRPPGTPAFNREGKLIGVFARRVQGGKAHHRVILPHAEVSKSLEQLDGSSEGPDLLQKAAQQVIDQYSDSIVTVSGGMEIGITVQGQSQNVENEIEIPGVLIREDGLVCIADPSKSLIDQIQSQVSRQVGGAKVEVTVEPKTAKLLLGDGTEVPGEIVLQDEDLHLAFIKAKPEEDESLEFVPLDLNDPAELEAFEEILVINRLPEDLNRQVAARPGRVSAVLKRPRLRYRSNVGGLGFPVFNAAGKLAGFQSLADDSSEGVILPVATLVKLIDQLKEESEEDGEE